MVEERTVYIIGAGFSHGFNPNDFPLMNNLFEKFTQEEPNIFSALSSEQMHELNIWFSQIFGDIELVDIEDALAYCDLIENGPINYRQDKDRILYANTIRDALKRYMTKRLRSDCTGGKIEYNKWAQTLSHNDTIITFKRLLIFTPHLTHNLFA